MPFSLNRTHVLRHLLVVGIPVTPTHTPKYTHPPPEIVSAEKVEEKEEVGRNSVATTPATFTSLRISHVSAT